MCCQGLRVRKVLSSSHDSTGVIWERCRSGHRVMSCRRVNMCCLVGQLHKKPPGTLNESVNAITADSDVCTLGLLFKCSDCLSATHLLLVVRTNVAFSLLWAPTACQLVECEVSSLQGLLHL